MHVLLPRVDACRATCSTCSCWIQGPCSASYIIHIFVWSLTLIIKGRSSNWLWLSLAGTPVKTLVGMHKFHPLVFGALSSDTLMPAVLFCHRSGLTQCFCVADFFPQLFNSPLFLYPIIYPAQLSSVLCCFSFVVQGHPALTGMDTMTVGSGFHLSLCH